MPTPTFLDVARSYLAGGFSVIPLEARGKKPALDWKEYQSRRPSESELVHWFYRANRNIGLVCGRVSGGLAVIDFDRAGQWEEWIDEDTTRWLIPTVTTSHGKHVYVRVEVPCGNRRYVDRGIDLRGEGGYVVAPPSIHPDGTTYVWSMANWYRIPRFKSMDDLGFPSVQIIEPPRREGVRTLPGGIPREIASFVARGTFPGNRDRKAFYAANRCRDYGVPRETAIELVAAGLSKSNPDRDPRQWAEEKVRNAYDK